MVRGDLYHTFLVEHIYRPALADASAVLELGDGACMVGLPPPMEQLRMFAVWVRGRYPAEAEAVLTSLWEDIKSVAPGGGRLPADTPPPWPPAS